MTETPSLPSEDKTLEMKLDYQSGKSVAEIARTYGVQPRWVYQIMQKDPEVERPSRSRGAIKPPLSKIHAQVGRAVVDHCFDKMLDRAAAAQRLGWSTLRLKNVELGVADITLFELQDIQAFTSRSYEELINGRR